MVTRAFGGIAVLLLMSMVALPAEADKLAEANMTKKGSRRGIGTSACANCARR